MTKIWVWFLTAFKKKYTKAFMTFSNHKAHEREGDANCKKSHLNVSVTTFSFAPRP